MFGLRHPALFRSAQPAGIGHTAVKWNTATTDGSVTTWSKSVDVIIPSGIAADIGRRPLHVRCNIWDQDIHKDDDFIGVADARLTEYDGKVSAVPSW